MIKAKLLSLVTAVAMIGCASSQEFVKSGIDMKKYKRIAVLPLPDYPGKPGSGIQVADLISVSLLSANFDVLDRTQTAQMLEEQQLGLSGLVNEETAPMVGEVLGAQALLTGSITEYGTSTRGIPQTQTQVKISNAGLTLKLVDSETGQIAWTGSARGKQYGENQEPMAAQQAIDDIIKKLRKHIQ